MRHRLSENLNMSKILEFEVCIVNNVKLWRNMIYLVYKHLVNIIQVPNMFTKFVVCIVHQHLARVQAPHYDGVLSYFNLNREY